MKIGIFAKTFSRPTVEGLFQTIAGYEIYSAQFNLSCAGLETLPGNVVSSELVQRMPAISTSASSHKYEAYRWLQKGPDARRE